MTSENPISCHEAVEQLWAFIDGELPADQGQHVHDHLDACRHCHPQYDYQKAFRAFLRHHSRETAPPALRRRIFLKLLEEESEEQP